MRSKPVSVVTLPRERTVNARRYDVVVAGGGMVGASLACALAELPLSIAVVEPFPFASAAQPSFDLRTTALSRSSQRILSSLGVWAEVAEFAAPIRRIHISEQGRFGSAVIDAGEQGVDSLGYVLENRRLGQVLWDRLAAADNIQLISPGEILAARPGAEASELDLRIGDGEQTIQARLLVVADGARSRLRAALGVACQERPYNQSAIIGTLKVSEPGDRVTAFERFTADGPMAILPASDDRYVFVLSRHSRQVESVLAMSDTEFVGLLQDTFGFRLGRILRVGQRSAYPLALTTSEQMTAPRAAIIGNAAHGLHPVAGQGYNLGLRDVATLAECLADVLRRGAADPGDAHMLSDYAAWRRSDQRKVVAFTDGLVRLFDLQQVGAGTARGLSLALFDLLPGAKRSLARHTMGLGGRLTRLSRGLRL